MVQDVEGEHEGFEEGRGEAVVWRRIKAEEVDALGGLGAGYLSRRLNEEDEEGWYWRHIWGAVDGG